MMTGCRSAVKALDKSGRRRNKRFSIKEGPPPMRIALFAAAAAALTLAACSPQTGENAEATADAAGATVASAADDTAANAEVAADNAAAATNQAAENVDAAIETPAETPAQ